MDSNNAILHGGRVRDRALVARLPGASIQERLGIPHNRHVAAFACGPNFLVSYDGPATEPKRLVAPSSDGRNVTYDTQGVMKYPPAAGKSDASSRKCEKEEEASDSEMWLHRPVKAHVLPFTSEGDDANGTRRDHDIIEYTPSNGDAQAGEDSGEAGPYDTPNTNAGGEHVEIKSPDNSHPDHALWRDDEESVEVKASDDRHPEYTSEGVDDENLYSSGFIERGGQISNNIPRTYAPFTSRRGDPPARAGTANGRPVHEMSLRLMDIELTELKTTVAAAKRKLVLLEQSNQTAGQAIWALQNFAHQNATHHTRITEFLCAEIVQLRNDLMTANEALRILQSTEEHEDRQRLQTKQTVKEGLNPEVTELEAGIKARLGAENTMVKGETHPMFEEELDAKIKQAHKLLTGHPTADQAALHVEAKSGPFKKPQSQLNQLDLACLDCALAAGEQTPDQTLVEASSTQSSGAVLFMRPEEQRVLAKQHEHSDPQDYNENIYSDPAVLGPPGTHPTCAALDHHPEEQRELSSPLVDSA
ncbi:hypothetical protein BKA63DRAFT_558894 [Paraphoma chrysanthemicola]|nr:hypothetical protein BKA63DRAFT_558894 [Paraphoma chrysanthemicola]